MPRPFSLELNLGDRKSICTCEKSSKMPLCDGSHKGSGNTPITINFISENTVKVTGTTCGGIDYRGEEEPKSGCCRTEGSERKGCGCRH